MKPKAVCLFSGGLDSTTTLFTAMVDDGMDVYPLSVDYGQRHRVELKCGRKILDSLDLPLQTLHLDFTAIAKSSLLDASVPLGSTPGPGIPDTFVPGRNIIFLSLAASYAVRIGASIIYTGFNAVDYSGYPDCRKEFIYLMSQAISEGLGVRLEIAAPLINLSKSKIIREALRLGVPVSDTWSCYNGGDTPCMKCDSCRIRAEAFEDLGIPDPALAA